MDKPTKWKAEDRRNDIKNQIRNVGIKGLPTYEELGKKYGVHKTQIFLDVQRVISEMSPTQLNEIFTDFHQADLRALEILKEIIEDGTNQEKTHAIKALVNLQAGTTDLLEAFSRKVKVADKHLVASVSMRVDSAANMEKIYNLVNPEIKLTEEAADGKKKKEISIQEDVD